VLGHPVRGNEEIAHGSGQIKQGVVAQDLHPQRHLSEQEEVASDSGVRQQEQRLLLLGTSVLPEDIEHLGAVLLTHDDISTIGARTIPILPDPTPLGKVVEEAVGGMRVVTRVREQRELPVQKDHGVASLQKILRRGGAARAGRKVVDESYGLVLEWDGGAAGGHEDYSPSARVVEIDELLELHRDCGQVRWRAVRFEVLELVIRSC